MSGAMTSRQRVLAAINHQPHDQVPVDLGSYNATSLTISAYAALREALGIAAGPIHVVDTMQMLADVEMPMIEALEIDVIGLRIAGGFTHGWQGWTIPAGVEVHMPADMELRPRPDGGWDLLAGGVRSGTMPAGGDVLRSRRVSAVADLRPRRADR